MKNRSHRLLRLSLVIAALALALPLVAGSAKEAPAPAAADAAPAPKPVKGEGSTGKGLAWLVSHQQPNGGFGQGEESAQMGGAGQLADTANVADTSIAALALVRAGNTLKDGPQKDNLARAVNYVLTSIEKSDDSTIFVTPVRGTRVQQKLGEAIDTFMAVTLMNELEGKMQDEAAQIRLNKALHKTLSKMQKNQRGDGSFETSGWAPVLAQGMAVKALSTAESNGFDVDEEVQKRAEEWSKNQVKGDIGFTGKGAGGAGVGLYTGSANTVALGSSRDQNERERTTVEKAAKEGKTADDRKAAQETLKRFDDTKKAADDAQAQLVARMNDPSFIAGFGNNGGEEFLSYMLMAETLRNGKQAEFAAWHQKMQSNLARVQNGDGSWTGHHCITGRTFVTSSALLVLMADKAPAGAQLSVKKLTGGTRG